MRHLLAAGLTCLPLSSPALSTPGLPARPSSPTVTPSRCLASGFASSPLTRRNPNGPASPGVGAGASPPLVPVATGSTAYTPEIPGAEGRNVLNTWQVLDGSSEIGERVVIVDTQGLPEASTVADFLVTNGKSVEIVTGLQYVGREITPPLWQHLYESLLRKGVKMTPFTGVFEILEDSLYVYDVVTWAPRYITGVDTVVIAAGGQAVDTLYRDLKDRAPDLHAIGDALQPRDIEVAVVDGHRTARSI